MNYVNRFYCQWLLLTNWKQTLRILLTTLLLSACTYPGGAVPTVKIGLIAPFEGLHRPLGYEAIFAVKLALGERNKAGGVNGYRVELIALNDSDNPVEAKIRAKAMVTDPDVWGVVGHLSSDTTLAAMPVYQAAGLAVVTPWTVDISADWSGWVSVAASKAETSAVLAEAGKVMHLNNIMKITDKETIAYIASDVQAIQLETEAVTAGEIILDLQQAGISLPFLGQVDVGSLQLVQVARSAANGLVFVSPGPGSDNIPDSFVNDYKILAGFPPGPRAVLAYDATNILLDAIEQTMSQTNNLANRSQVGAVITNIRRRGISGDIAFNAKGRRINAPVWVYQISKEKYPGVGLEER